MAAVLIGGAQDLGLRLPQCTRSVVRTSGGGLYVVGIDWKTDPNGTYEVAVWYSADGVAWVEKDAANRPTAESVGGSLSGVSVAIDSSNVLHMIWYDITDGKFQYTTFATATDQWNGGNAAAVTKIADEIDGPAVTDGSLVAITIDSADKAHVVWQDSDKVHGTSYDTVMYSNNVSGWKAGVQVEGYTAEKQCRYPDITVNSSDIPCIVYINNTDTTVTAAKGNQNDAGSFTLKDVETSVNNIANGAPSIACDSGGDIWIAFVDADASPEIAKQSSNWTDAWSIYDSGQGGYSVSMAINGTDVHIFYQDNLNLDIIHNMYDGSWKGETTLEEGTYDWPKARWAQCNNYSYASVGIDYVFKSGNDMYWNTLSIAAPAVYKQQVIMID